MGGLSGAFIPVSEDKNMIDAASSDCLTIEKLEAMTCVCSVGLDMIAIPGDTSASTISGLIADEAAIGMVNQKTTAVRVIPVAGKGVGEMANFGGLMGYAPIMPVNQTSCEAFVTRGGRIPARFTASRTDSVGYLPSKRYICADRYLLSEGYLNQETPSTSVDISTPILGVSSFNSPSKRQ